jgi:alpha-tubulin suppressor-like RCC1 family protein
MKRLLSILILCGCAGSFVDHTAFNAGGTPECIATCTTSVPGAGPLCIGSTCTYECQGGRLKCADGCCDVTALSAGTSHTCAVVASAVVAGEARCWGGNDKGQLGQAGILKSYSPVQPSGIIGKVTAIAAGWTHTCAVTNGAVANGEVWCWGDDTDGQLGDRSSSASTPRRISSLSGVVAIGAGGGHTCAATATQLFCWGRNDSGQIGDGTSSGPRVVPTAVSGVSGPVAAVALGESHTCALTSSGVSCWGANDKGQLGNGTVAPSSTPVASLNSASFLGLGANHSCAGDSSKLFCWGANAQDQVYRSGPDQLSPKDVLSNAGAVVGGFGHTCAVTTSQDMKCWGLNDQGQIGAPPGSGHEEDVTIPGVWQAAAAGSKHTCALQNKGAFCWGSNDQGQLGTNLGVQVSSAAPVAVSGR